MSKKVKVLVSVLVAVVLLTIGGASLVMGADGTNPPPSADNATALKGLLPRVATILGIPEPTLVAAFKQAEKQIKDEVFLKALDKAVASGRLTQDEADKLKAWWQQRPDVANGGIAPFARMFAKHGGLRLLTPGSDNTTASGNVTGLLPRVATILDITVDKLESAIKQAQQEMQAESFLKMVDKAVAKGVITQTEADQIKAWWTQRPEAVNRLLQQILKAKPNQRGQRGMRGKMRGGMMQGSNMPQGMGGGMMQGSNMPQQGMGSNMMTGKYLVTHRGH